MNLGFDHLYISSFKERLDHLITSKLEAWKNVSVPLILDTKDDRLSYYSVANGGNRQWVYDSSIVGANIASTDSLSGAWEDAHVDFRNARIISETQNLTTAPATLNVAQKYFNVYVSSFSDQDLFAKLAYDQAPELTSQTEPAKNDSYFAPCVFVKTGRTMNEGWALGGEDKTSFDIKVTVFARSEAELIAIGGVIRDMNQTATYLFDYTPLNEFNDLKNRPFNFRTKMQEMAALGQPKIIIEECYFNPIKSDALNSKLPNIFIGLGTFKTFVTRHPRQ